MGESYQAFGYVDNVHEFTAVQKILIRSVGSLAMFFAASKIKCELKHGCAFDKYIYIAKLKDSRSVTFLKLGCALFYLARRNITDERLALRDALTKWENEGLGGNKNSFGSKMGAPDMGDLAVFGVLKSVSGLLAHEEEVLGRIGPFLDWYVCMEEHVNRK